MFRPPQRRITPCIGDGDASQLEWHHAGTYLPGSEQGAMHRAERLAKKLWFGCDNASLYLRLDLVQPDNTPPFKLALTITHPNSTEVVQARTAILRKLGPGAFTITRTHGKPMGRTTLAVGKSIEWRLALRDLDLPPGTPFAIQLAMVTEGIERERYPERSTIPLCT